MLNAKAAREQSLQALNEKRSYEKLERMFNSLLQRIEEDILQSVSDGLFSMEKYITIEKDLKFLTENRIKIDLQKHGYNVEINSVGSNMLSQIQRKCGKDKVGLKISVSW